MLWMLMLWMPPHRPPETLETSETNSPTGHNDVSGLSQLSQVALMLWMPPRRPPETPETSETNSPTGHKLSQACSCLRWLRCSGC